MLLCYSLIYRSPHLPVPSKESQVACILRAWWAGCQARAFSVHCIKCGSHCAAQRGSEHPTPTHVSLLYSYINALWAGALAELAWLDNCNGGGGLEGGLAGPLLRPIPVWL